jgi:hypothetical protein
LSTPPIQNSDLAERYQGLFKLASGYVNGAWDYTHGSAEAAVMAFIEDQSDDLRASAAAGIDALFSDYPDEASRHAVLSGWGWNYGGIPGRVDALLTWARARLETGRA